MSNLRVRGPVLALIAVLAIGGCVAADEPEATSSSAAPSPTAELLSPDEAAALFVDDGAGGLTPVTLGPDESVWLEPAPATFEVDLPSDSLAAPCSYTQKLWAAATVNHAAWTCSGGLCHWSKYQVVEQVACNNYCSSSSTWSCTAYGTATHPGHATTQPAVSPNSACQIPCGALSTCSGCIYN